MDSDNSIVVVRVQSWVDAMKINDALRAKNSTLGAIFWVLVDDVPSESVAKEPDEVRVKQHKADNCQDKDPISLLADSRDLNNPARRKQRQVNDTWKDWSWEEQRRWDHCSWRSRSWDTSSGPDAAHRHRWW